MKTPNNVAVDVWAALGGLTDLARHRLTMKRREFDRAVAAGKRPHEELQIKAERAEYLLQQGNAAIDVIRELVEAAEAELVEVERRDRIGAIRPEERGTIESLRAALRRFATGGEA